MILPNIADEPLYPEPLFPVEQPDGRRDWPEIDRQATLLQIMRYAAPKVIALPIPNAGKRNPRLARKEGIVGGAFDLLFMARGPLVAAIELKGYTRAGRAGALTTSQIEMGNRLYRAGIPCACFFSPHRAVEWLRDQGFVIAEVRDAA